MSQSKYFYNLLHYNIFAVEPRGLLKRLAKCGPNLENIDDVRTRSETVNARRRQNKCSAEIQIVEVEINRVNANGNNNETNSSDEETEEQHQRKLKALTKHISTKSILKGVIEGKSVWITLKRLSVKQ